jgi:hypothetical protein
MLQKPADPAYLAAKFAFHDLLVDHGGVSSSGPAESQRAGAQKESAGNYFPTLISTAYTSITSFPRSRVGMPFLPLCGSFGRRDRDVTRTYSNIGLSIGSSNVA